MLITKCFLDKVTKQLFLAARVFSLARDFFSPLGVSRKNIMLQEKKSLLKSKFLKSNLRVRFPRLNQRLTMPKLRVGGVLV